MAESLVAVTQGSGKNLHTFNRTIGANSVEDEVMIEGEHYLSTYVCNGGTTSIATANDHQLQLLAGASLNVMLRRVMVYQAVAATTAAICLFDLFSVTTAGTGGTASTPFRLDNADAASGAAGMTLPTAKGTESRRFWRGAAMMMQTVPTAGGSLLLFDLNFDQLRQKAIIIPAGTTNGVVFKNLTAIAGASVYVNFYFSEANFL